MSRAKTASYNRLLAIDPSLTATGWALFQVSTSSLIGVGLVVPPGPTVLLAERLSRLQQEVSGLLAAIKLGATDLVICEGPAPLVDNPQSALKVEHVRGIFEALARERSASVPGRLNPRTVQSELLGLRGKQLARNTVKACARETVRKLYGAELASFSTPRRKMPQDIIDAILIGTLALARVHSAGRTGVPVQTVFATTASSARGGGRRSSRSASWSEDDLRAVQRR